MTATATATKPKRIQRKRTKGWRMPENAVYVGRPTRWGNPFAMELFNGDADKAMSAYRDYVEKFPQIAEAAKRDLRGKDLACWCKEGARCHADILLELANQ